MKYLVSTRKTSPDQVPDKGNGLAGKLAIVTRWSRKRHEMLTRHSTLEYRCPMESEKYDCVNTSAEAA